MARDLRISPDSSVPIRSASCRTWTFSASVTAADMRCSRLSPIYRPAHLRSLTIRLRMPIRSICPSSNSNGARTISIPMANRSCQIMAALRATSSTQRSATRTQGRQMPARRGQLLASAGSEVEGHKSGLNSDRGIPNTASYRIADCAPTSLSPR